MRTARPVHCAAILPIAALTAAVVLPASLSVEVGAPDEPEFVREHIETVLRCLDRRITAEFVDTPADEVRCFLMTLSRAPVLCSCYASDWQEPGTRCTENWQHAPVTATYRDAPVSCVLDDMCAREGLDWTLVPVKDYCGYPTPYIAGPAEIARIEAKFPNAARMVRDYRRRAWERRASYPFRDAVDRARSRLGRLAGS